MVRLVIGIVFILVVSWMVSKAIEFYNRVKRFEEKKDVLDELDVQKELLDMDEQIIAKSERLEAKQEKLRQRSGSRKAE